MHASKVQITCDGDLTPLGYAVKVSVWLSSSGAAVPRRTVSLRIGSPVIRLPLPAPRRTAPILIRGDRTVSRSSGDRPSAAHSSGSRNTARRRAFRVHVDAAHCGC